ncbi:MAG: nitroreductase family protein [Treponema sp.]|jgi:nitroreductase|nr:nitroreductase family protein [Treponema sp.]
MKKQCVIYVLFLTALSSLAAQATSNLGMKPILEHYAASNFIAGAVSKGDLDLIVKAGVRAPSASNRQPWHFTVIQSYDLVKQIMPSAVEGNVLIVVSVPGTGWEIFDGGLATESMYLAAQALGYGSRIYTGGRDALNNRFKAALGLPSGYSALGLVRIGRVAAGIDAISAASSRKSVDAVVSYK